jgi:hypothetical protein
VLPRPLSEPWWDLSVNDPTAVGLRRVYTTELRTECAPQHVLATRQFDAAAKCLACDHALYALDGQEWALVHLTWRQAAEPDSRWPLVEALGAWDDVCSAAESHAEQHR